MAQGSAPPGAGRRRGNAPSVPTPCGSHARRALAPQDGRQARQGPLALADAGADDDTATLVAVPVPRIRSRSFPPTANRWTTAGAGPVPRSWPGTAAAGPGSRVIRR